MIKAFRNNNQKGNSHRQNKDKKVRLKKTGTIRDIPVMIKIDTFIDPESQGTSPAK